MRLILSLTNSCYLLVGPAGAHGRPDGLRPSIIPVR